MSEPEDFLSRWSRRKREVAEEAAAESAKPDLENAANNPAGENAAKPQTAESEAAEAAEPVFDISKLPSIDEITAETDIRPFLSAGVPAHLTQAALRKLWVTDPKIRDFIEIAENQWDFNAGNIPGFDYSLPENAKELVAQIFSKAAEPVEKTAELDAGGKPESASAQTPISPEPERTTTPAKFATVVAAPTPGSEQNENIPDSGQIEPLVEGEDQAEVAPAPRRHGSALPS
jgi:hypothetical protein